MAIKDVPNCVYTGNACPCMHLYGDIDNDRTYPFGVLTEEESDQKYAVKETEALVKALQAESKKKVNTADFDGFKEVVNADFRTVKENLNKKADKTELEAFRNKTESDIETLYADADTKATKAELSAVEVQKADKSAVQALEGVVATKANRSELAALSLIVENKADKSSFPYVTPEMYGAKGDGKTDDTIAIQSALDSDLPTVFTGSKTYMVSISDDSYISLRGFKSALNIADRINKQVYFNGATIKLNTVDNTSGTNDRYCILAIDNSKHITVDNAFLVGDYDTHIGTHTEYEHCIIIMRSSQIHILNTKCTKLFGDGITIQSESSAFEGEKCSSFYIYIKNCIINDLGRNGVSVIGGKYVYISKCQIYDVSKTSPYACIDIEGNSNAEYDYPEYIYISECYLTNQNYAYRDYGRAKNVQIENCTIDALLFPAGENINVYNSKIQRLTCFVNSGAYSCPQSLQVFNSKIENLQTSANSKSKYYCCEIQATSINNNSTAEFNSCDVAGTIYSFGISIFNNCTFNVIVTVDTGKASFIGCVFNVPIRCRGNYYTENDITILLKSCYVKYGFRIEDGVDSEGNNYTDKLKIDCTNCDIERIDSNGNNGNVTFDFNGINAFICKDCNITSLNHLVVGKIRSLELYGCNGYLANGSAIRETFPVSQIGQNIKIVGCSVNSPSSAGQIITADEELGNVYIISSTFQGRSSIGTFTSTKVTSHNNYPLSINIEEEQTDDSGNSES